MVSVCAACVVGAVVALASPVAAEPLEREHYSFQDQDTFTDTECGEPITIDYVVEGSGLFMLKKGRAGDPTPYLFDNYSAVETFTNVANGKTATVVHQGLYKDLKVEHIEGTIYQFTAIETGRPVVAFGPDGKRLPLWDRGRIRVTFIVDTKGDADLSNDEFLDLVAEDVAGPHPIYFGDAGFCELLSVIR
jgi:hypothetical protein